MRTFNCVIVLIVVEGENKQLPNHINPKSKPHTCPPPPPHHHKKITESSSSSSSTTLSNRKSKQTSRLTVAELKQLVANPSLVETCDVTAPDPTFLVYLKSYPNTVAVPQHWSQKRKYLQGKRGFEKVPFCLPKFIEDTGIAEIRGSVQEDEEKSSSRQKGRQRVAPKMGKIDVDYKTLHDAFFKYQTKPKMTKFGQLYYEGKVRPRPGPASEAKRSEAKRSTTIIAI